MSYVCCAVFPGVMQLVQEMGNMNIRMIEHLNIYDIPTQKDHKMPPGFFPKIEASGIFGHNSLCHVIMSATMPHHIKSASRKDRVGQSQTIYYRGLTLTIADREVGFGRSVNTHATAKY